MYTANVDTGETNDVEIPDDIEYDHPLHVPGGILGNESSTGEPETYGNDYRRKISRRFVPSTGFKYV